MGQFAHGPITQTIHVDERLADVLEMFGTKTTPKDLFRYAAEAAGLPERLVYSMDGPTPGAAWFMVELVTALTPPEDRRMSFKDRPPWAAKMATPWDFSEVVDAVMGMGWSGMSVPGGSALESLTGMRDGLNARARDLAKRYLETWEKKGKVYRLS